MGLDLDDGCVSRVDHSAGEITQKALDEGTVLVVTHL